MGIEAAWEIKAAHLKWEMTLKWGNCPRLYRKGNYVIISILKLEEGKEAGEIVQTVMFLPCM